MHLLLTIILLPLLITIKSSICQEVECIRRTPDWEQTNTTPADPSGISAEAAGVTPFHKWNIKFLRSAAGLLNLSDLATLARTVTPPQSWDIEGQEPRPFLLVTCSSVGEGGERGRGEGEALGGRGGVWADVADASAIPAISELIPRITRLRIRRLADAEILSPLVANARVLRQLNLASASSSLGRLPSTWLMGAKYQLIRLDASNCGITGISDGTFKGAPLRWLNLAGNSIKRLDKGALSDLTSLQHLDLSRNVIVELNEDAFSSLTALRSLDLSFNGLRKPSLVSVVPLSSLVVLSVGNNALGGEGPIPLPANLHVLLADNAGLEDKDLDLNTNKSELRVLHVSGNGLTRLPSLPHLQELNASANQLVSLAVWPELRSLDVSHNKKLDNLCTSVSEKAAPGLRLLIADGVETSYDQGVFLKQCKLPKSITILSAGGLTSLKSLPSDAFASLQTENRVFLKISNNANLKHIEENALRGLRLQTLDLSNNSLSGLSPGTAPWSDASSVDLQGNPWRCECNLQWMLDELLPDLYRWTPELLDDVRCTSPPELHGVRFVHWFNHSDRVFCGRMQHFLARGERQIDGDEVHLQVSSGTLVAIVASGIVAVALVGLGLCAHHRYVRRLRVRNRRL